MTTASTRSENNVLLHIAERGMIAAEDTDMDISFSQVDKGRGRDVWRERFAGEVAAGEQVLQ